ncbi:4'-phosphopantetheinyl transferase [Pseudodesulfovibrio sp. JC047]|uniref:cation:proton antiporter family protein n=1 Tax=Pseudodesulfovibrio sp. JC047 TaxID=2683199 RepID=UPI0013D62B08|nr:cation:proton antiporter family protein [Pseudodesulfovibrio sp. JC047]NDV19685.1 4'-phosphopantetheinyl transferase [Pseudodesulfovibrio sp. JC047]
MYIDPLVIVCAFGFGYVASRTGLPPLVGYLVAGFILSTQGYTTGPIIQEIADIGVTILLFTIGLKLKIKSLLRPEVWAGASLHMLITVTLFTIGLLGLAASGLTFFTDLDWRTAALIAFALSFSSTVFAVKILDESGRSSSLNGRTAIGVLIIQDIFAVLFLAFSTGKIPSAWAIAVIAALPVARWLFMRILNRIGHGELQILFGFFLAFVAGAWAFDIVGLKADLGALIMGMLLAPHARASDLATSLYSIKDFLLVGFFLEIGLAGLPSINTLNAALLFVLATPIKVALFFFLFTRFRLKARTSLITSFNLANYSEFGLIVCGVAVANGWLSRDWLLALAVAMSLSFVIASPFNAMADRLFNTFRRMLKRFETVERHPDEEQYDAGTWQIVVVGMGRVGTGAYAYFTDKFGPVVLGIDFNADTVDALQERGKQVLLADVTDPDFWHKLPTIGAKVSLVILTVPNLTSQLFVVERLKHRGYSGKIAAMATYDDEVEILQEAGVSTSFNVFAEAGIGLASHICREMDISSIEPHATKDSA